MLFVPKELSSYGGKLLRRDTWQRIANGQINLKYAVINTAKSLGKRGLRMAGPLLEALPALSRERREVHHAFQAIENHRARLSLLHKCGPPLLADHHCAPLFDARSGRAVPEPWAGAIAGCQMIEELLYDRGPGNLLATVRVRAGVVQAILYGQAPR